MVCIDVQNRQNFEYHTAENGPFTKKAAINRENKEELFYLYRYTSLKKKFLKS